MSKFAPTRRQTGRVRRPSVAGFVSLGVIAAAAVLVVSQPASAGIVPTVQLATAANYSVLGATTVTNTNPSVIGQSVGLSPGPSIVGFPPGIVLAPGTIQGADAVTGQAQDDLTTAYLDAAGRSVEFPTTNADLVGLTLAPGVYSAASKAPLGLSGALVLDGQGDPNAVFIFQTDSTLITSSGSSITVINGASECNVFWQVGSSATLGSGSTFVGSILALTSITVESSAVVQGRALARNGAVTLDDNVFTAPSCQPSTVPGSTTTMTAVGGGGTTTVGGGGTTTSFNPTDITLPRTGVDDTTNPTSTFGPPGSLPATGAFAASTSLAGAAFLAVGAVALLVVRRRRPV
ncbi:MAG TPA: ice-binding family protein [Ilumatobacteraceae bacterium]|nr:ice-binding family protein [Ilumatobacteraceae bacterium]HRB01712.1 ice-binding family protein [Ilumatobacteraceae bacterium]